LERARPDQSGNPVTGVMVSIDDKA
jgi:hypothetical protein